MQMEADIAKLPGILFCCLLIIFGALHVYGAYRRWPMLVNPPKKSRFIYSQAALRALFGERGVVAFTYSFGVLLIAAGALGLWNGFR